VEQGRTVSHHGKQSIPTKARGKQNVPIDPNTEEAANATATAEWQ